MANENLPYSAACGQSKNPEFRQNRLITQQPLLLSGQLSTKSKLPHELYSLRVHTGPKRGGFRRPVWAQQKGGQPCPLSQGMAACCVLSKGGCFNAE